MRARLFKNQPTHHVANKEHTDTERMEKIVSLCKRRGFIFQAAELYGGLNGCWDYGPLGAELKRNLKDYWWRKHVQERDDVLGMDGSILTHQAVLKSSGHIGGFSDPMRECLLSKARLRADQIEPQTGTAYHFAGASHEESGWSIERPFSVLLNDPSRDENYAYKKAREYYAEFLSDKQISPKKLTLHGNTTTEEKDSVDYNPENGSLLGEPRDFELMFKTKMGATGHDIAYLRPETAQSIFVQYKNILDSNRIKLPFGIAQIGKSFRNEINPRNFTFRSREFEQLEIEYFCHPDDGMRLTDEWLETRLKFYEAIGIPREKLHVIDIPDEDRAFYSAKTYDIEYDFPFGQQELEGVAYRTDYDLRVHQEGSGKTLEYYDEETKKRFIPHVVEPSAGCDRTVLALICEAYDEEDLGKDGKSDMRTVLRFTPQMAPIKVAILPLLKNKTELVEKAKEVKNLLQPFMNVAYDEAAAIGRRYRRQDEAGTPFCIAIDFQTIGEADENGNDLTDTVTIRHRDSMEQERLPISEVLPWLLERIR